MCLEDVGLEQTQESRDIGVVIGTTMGNQDVAERVIDAFDLKRGDVLNDEAARRLAGFRPSELSLQVSRRFNLNGPTMVSHSVRRVITPWAQHLLWCVRGERSKSSLVVRILFTNLLHDFSGLVQAHRMYVVLLAPIEPVLSWVRAG